MITFDVFEKVDMCIGKVAAVESSSAKKPTYRFPLDFGPEIGVKKSCAALTNYPIKELTGRLVVAVANFPPKKWNPKPRKS